jgi:hypothetical protein
MCQSCASQEISLGSSKNQGINDVLHQAGAKNLVADGAWIGACVRNPTNRNEDLTGFPNLSGLPLSALGEMKT